MKLTANGFGLGEGGFCGLAFSVGKPLLPNTCYKLARLINDKI